MSSRSASGLKAALKPANKDSSSNEKGSSSGSSSSSSDSPIKTTAPPVTETSITEPMDLQASLKNINDLLHGLLGRQTESDNAIRDLTIGLADLQKNKAESKSNASSPPATAAASTVAENDDEVTMHRDNVDKDKTPAQSDDKKKEPATPGSLISQLKNMTLTDRASDSDSGSSDDDKALRERKKFDCVKLTTSAKLPEILEMQRSMIDHREQYGDKVKWKQVLERDLKMQLLSLLPAKDGVRQRKYRLEDFKKIKSESAVFKLLVANARVRTKLEFTSILKSFKPAPKFISQRLTLNLFSTEIKALIRAHIDEFCELYDTLMLNDPALCPPTWNKTSNPGGGIDQEPLISIFLNSFPHEIGKSLHRMLQISRRGTFKEYVYDFEQGLDAHSEHADNVRSLQVFFQEANGAKKGSSKTHESLNLIHIEAEDLIYEDYLFAMAAASDKSSMRGCFKMALTGQCSDGKNCKWDHGIPELEKTADFLIAQYESRLSSLKQRKYKRPAGLKVNALEEQPAPVTILSRSEKVFLHSEPQFDDWSMNPSTDDSA